jgi:hypothetical protein
MKSQYEYTVNQSIILDIRQHSNKRFPGNRSRDIHYTNKFYFTFCAFTALNAN